MDFFWIWLLAIAPGVSGVTGVAGCFALLTSAILLIVYLVATEDRNEELKAEVGGRMRFLAKIGGACLVVSALVPSPRQMAEAYFLLEAPKVANAENAKAAAQAAEKAVNRVLDIVEKAADDK